MKKLILTIILVCGGILFLPQSGYASDSWLNTHTSTPRLEPALQFIQADKAFQTASVCFMGFGDCDPNTDYSIDTAKQCLDEGYVKLNCSSIQEAYDVCPYNSAYGRGCRCNTNLMACANGQVGVGESCGGKYISCKCSPTLISCPADKIGSGASCGDKYETCGCKSEYIYTSSNCASPRSLSGSSCDGKYSGCSCPSGVSAGSYGCAEYYASPCSGVCKRAKDDNCDNRTAVSTPYGCAEYWSDCPSKCKTAYNDNCRNRTAVTCPFGCSAYFGDCTSKCSACDGDNCKNRTEVSVPDNASCSTYYSDCLSKCSEWVCNSGYTKSGDSCIQDKPKTCEDVGLSTTQPIGQGCVRAYNLDLQKFCYDLNSCKICRKNITCSNGCALYNYGENEMDLYGCPRVCIGCLQSKPNCGSQTLITCNGQYYCCPPRAASCYYTTPHNFSDGTTTVMCSLASRQESFGGNTIDGSTKEEFTGGTTDGMNGNNFSGEITETVGGLVDLGDITFTKK